MENILIMEGDITQLKVDAIVNAANPQMLGGGGVDGAIHRAAGPALLEACKKVPPKNGIRCPFGEARITPAGNLDSKYVIHTAGPIYASEKDPKSVLASCYRQCLLLAIENHCDSIAFPAISCGAYGYPIQEAALVAIQACSDKNFSELNIIFCLFGDHMISTWQPIYEKLSENRP